MHYAVKKFSVVLKLQKNMQKH